VRDDADIAKIDATLKRDPALAFKLLRLVNSAAFGLPVQITSFQHAVMMLGYKKLMRWLSLLLATASKDGTVRLWDMTGSPGVASVPDRLQPPLARRLPDAG